MRTLRQHALARLTPNPPRRLTVALNWLALSPAEVSRGLDGVGGRVATLTADDRRTVHVRTVLRAGAGSTVRISLLGEGLTMARVLSGGVTDDDAREVGSGQRSALGRGAGTDSRTSPSPPRGPLVLVLDDDGGSGERDTFPPPPRVHLLLAHPRPKVLMRLWSSIAAVGVASVVVTAAERVERVYWGGGATRPSRVWSGLVSGLEQSGDWRVPPVAVTRSKDLSTAARLAIDAATRGPAAAWAGLPAAAESDGPGGPRGVAASGGWFFEPGPRTEGSGSGSGSPPILVVGPPRRLDASSGAAPSVHTVIRRAADGHPAAPVIVAVGPEGGWTEKELSTLSAAGFIAASLGPRVLATTEATVSLLALSAAALEEGTRDEEAQ